MIDQGIKRSELEKRLRGEGYGRSMTDEQLDRLKYMERRIEKETGMGNGHGAIRDDIIEKLDPHI